MLDNEDFILVAEVNDQQLYIDSNYSCLVITGVKEITQIDDSLSLDYFCKNGFFTISSDEIKDLVPDCIATLTEKITSVQMLDIINDYEQKLQEKTEAFNRLMTISNSNSYNLAKLEQVVDDTLNDIYNIKPEDKFKGN